MSGRMRKLQSRQMLRLICTFGAVLGSLVLLAISSGWAEPIVYEEGFSLELWLSEPRDLRGVTAGPGGAFGNFPYVSNLSDGSIMRVLAPNLTETLASGLPVGGASNIAFDPSGSFGGDMFVSWPDRHWEEADPIYRITPEGQVSLYFQSNQRNGLTQGLAFGTGQGFGDDLYIRNDKKNNLLRFSSTGSSSEYGTGGTAGTIGDDLVFSSGGAFGNYAYMTWPAENGRKILRMSPDGHTEVFATDISGIALAFGEGVFGEKLYLGTGTGEIVAFDPSGQRTVFASGFTGLITKNRIRGLDIDGDTMWLTVSDGPFYGIVAESQSVPEPSTMLLMVIGLVGLAGFRRKVRK